MSEVIFSRAALDVTETDGRTLIGTAFFFDRPSLVRDATGPAYLEEFSRSSIKKTLAENKVFPMFVNHRHDANPVGAVRFEAGADALMFEAKLSATQASDEALALVNDGAMRSVSVNFRALANTFRDSKEGRILTRSDIALRELSLAATGFAQHQGAEILAVRSIIETPKLDALRRRRILL